MHRYVWSIVGLVVLATTLVLASVAQAGGAPATSAGPMTGVIPIRGQAAASAADLIYHGGPVMTTGADVTPIFWGTSWGSDPQNKKGWLATFYMGMGGSSYAGTNGEYTDFTGGHVGTTFTVHTAITDLGAAPKNGSRTAPILAEVAKLISNPVPNGYYPVYVDTPRKHAGFCAWHSVGTAQGVTVQFAFFFNLDGDPGCEPGSTSNTYSQGVAALANVSGHELSEALTDPHLNAWYDSGGAENADRCAWTFGRPMLTLSNGSQWKVQGNYSNAAAAAGSGYDGGGCIDGG